VKGFVNHGTTPLIGGQSYPWISKRTGMATVVLYYVLRNGIGALTKMERRDRCRGGGPGGLAVLCGRSMACKRCFTVHGDCSSCPAEPPSIIGHAYPVSAAYRR
jgi:hypothetical protein